MLQVALFITALCSLLLGVAVYISNPRSIVFKLYFAFCLLSALWMTVNAVVVNSPVMFDSATLLLFAQCITPLSLLTSLSFYLFLKLFIKNRMDPVEWLDLVPTLAVSAFSFIHFNVYLDASGQLALGGLYPFYLVVLLFNVLLVFYSLYSPSTVKLAHNASQIVQLSYLRIGALAAILPAILFGSILPIFSSSSLSNLGPLFSVFMLLAATIAIVKHRLFDIKFYVVRAVAYLFTFFLIALVYVAPAVFLLVSGIMGLPFLPLRFVLGVVFITVIALYFHKLRHWFDQTTSKIFLRDSYDAAEVLAKLNNVLVTSRGLDEMLRASSELLALTFKAEYCVFALNQTTHTSQRYVGTTTIKISITDMERAEHIIFPSNSNVIITGFLNDEQKTIKSVLKKHNAAVLIRLSHNTINKEGNLGYIFLGFKKSGNTYSDKDAGALSAMADVLTIALQNALRYEEIHNFNATLQQQINDATRKLQRTNTKLIALDETKDDFISMASHQLRTPLTAVKGYLSMVIEGDAGSLTDLQRQMLDQSFVSSQRMVSLISDLLNVSRLKTGKFVIESSRQCLQTIIQEEVDQLQSTARTRKVTLTYDKPPKLPDVMIDETKIRQVIMNFIDNAIYYTPSGGHVTVSLHETAASIEMHVQDDGIGVPKAEQPHLFTKFYRAGNARRARPDGTGLGLFMAKKVVVAQGGAVIFKSTEGKGSTFGFVFPKTKILAPKPVEMSAVALAK